MILAPQVVQVRVLGRIGLHRRRHRHHHDRPTGLPVTVPSCSHWRASMAGEPLSDARHRLPPATPAPAPCSTADHIAAVTRLSPHRYTTAMHYLVAGLVFIPSLALADIAGPAKVIDGDTIEISGQRIRLHGIDAQEGRQTCRRDAVTWLCGAEGRRTAP